ncbi:hypothetical protein [Sulfurospirillum arcachonense]|uniref:hypothetical protein n=1 Tax=Sulfurospirillum arcachonense TaxID=57666 RepID=UPI000468AF09|nr:hypothetical protein [Sulfurospirillum arcachonense]
MSIPKSVQRILIILGIIGYILYEGITLKDGFEFMLSLAVGLLILFVFEAINKYIHCNNLVLYLLAIIPIAFFLITLISNKSSFGENIALWVSVPFAYLLFYLIYKKESIISSFSRVIGFLLILLLWVSSIVLTILCVTSYESNGISLITLLYGVVTLSYFFITNSIMGIRSREVY